MATPAQLLEAGALLAPNAKLKDNDGIDTVSARSYSHPALAQPVVRLTADNLANGDDLMMEYLGFGEAEVTGPVAKQRRQALGFPGWALVNDPDHARYALELVKEFRKEIRRANSKPGHAWEGLTEIAKRLGKSVAHFLPSFWEQTGREFIAVGNATYASRAFSKAREAEGVHGLKVDENLRQDSFLEFALAGCVSAKALTQYGKDLLAAHEPVEAWEFMKNLTVRRTLGGLPPWTNVCKDLAPLIKAAGKDPKEELPVLLELMLDSPAMNRAAMGFWKSASPYIKVLAAKEPRVAGTLLNLIPKSTSWSDPEIWQWLGHLKSWDILENAWATGIPEEAGPKDGPAAWFHRLLEANSTCPQLAFDVLEQMADRLIADGTAVDLYRTYRWDKQQSVDLDLLDLALSLKISVADPTDRLMIHLSTWASNPANDPTSKDRPRDPLFVKKDKRFTQKLVDAVDSVAGDNNFEDAAQGKTALKEARKLWLMKTLDELCGGGMPDFDDKQASFVQKTRPATFQEFPDAAAKLKKLDPLPSLINTLKTFVPAEYGWPKLEEVVDQFEGDHKLLDDLNQPKSKLLICGSFPDAIVSDGIKAVVVRGDKVIHEAELKLPKNKTLMGLQFLDGDLKVIVKQDYQSLQFWNSKPKVSDTAYGSDKANLTAPVLHLEGGGTFTGNHVIHAGDAQHLTSTEPGSFFHDGTTIWNLDWDDSYNERETREFDIATGKKGRKSLPAFFEDFAKQEMKLQPSEMQLLSYPGLVDESPLGCKDSLVGFRIRSNEKGKYECESIDGRSFTTTSTQLKPTSLLQQPGTKAFLPVVFDRSYRGFECEVYSANGELRSVQYSNNSDTYIQGHTTAYPQAFWHVLKVRDIETSKLLRKITRKQVQTLVDAAAKDADGRKKPKAGEPFLVKNLNAAIKKTFPKLKDPRLQEGIRSIVLRFERRSRELLKQIENRDPAKARKTNVPSVDDQKIIQTVKNVGEHIYTYRAANLAEGIADAAAFFSGELEATKTSMATVTAVSALLSNLPAKAWLLSWMQEDEADDAWRKTFDLISQTPLCDFKGSFRIVELGTDSKLPFPVPDECDDDEDDDDGETTFTWTKGSSRFLISKDWRTYTVLEYSKTGKFAKLTGIDPESATEFSNHWTSKQLKEFLTESAKHLHQYPSLDFAKELAEEMNLSVAELSLIWFGFPRLDAYEANFMPKHLRTAMKLKTKEASAAKESLKMIEPAIRMDLLNQALDGNISDLWQDPPTAFADRLKAVFQSSQPDVSFIPTEHSETFGKILGYRSQRAELMKAFSSPKDHPWFSPRSKWKLALDDGNLTLVCQPSDAEFDSDLLKHSALCIAWLSYVLPVGHASLAKIGPLQDALLKALANPNLLLDAGSSWLWELDDDKAREKLITAAIGKPKKQKGMLIADDGTLIAGLASNTLERAFRPAKLEKPADYQKVQNQLDASATKEYVRRCDAIWLVELVRDPHFAAIIERLQSTKLEEGQFEANPLHSCPALVKKVAKAKNLSEEGAAYYLQLLCLPDPTDRNIKLWTGWTAVQMKKASAELLESELVLEAKRPRAGRKLFLPGGWEALKAPHLPLETWKLPLFNMYRDTYDRATPILPLIVPLQPVHELFAAGWKRITSGDEPKYEEV